jgi:hypothetical protein
MEGKLNIFLFIIFCIKLIELDHNILISFLPITKKIEEAIIGDMLGDGHIGLDNIKK